MDPTLETVLKTPDRALRTAATRPSLLVTLLLTVVSLTARADAPQAGLSPATIQRIDAAAAEVLAETGTPSASIAIVRDGRIVYTQAYGKARIEPNPIAARPAMRYAIGSITKQFTAAALLLLQQDGKLSLDDKVAKYVPGLTRAGDITIRQLLTHTSGYQDYWPQDYTFTAMLEPTTPAGILDRWARQPLDFEPGTRWQYSNTGYVIAALVVEKVSGQPFHAFLEQRILTPLDLASTSDFDREPHAHGTVAGYDTYALGPPRRSKASGQGWLFGAGGLAMTAADLARWDISLMRRSLLNEASYRALETDTLLANGVATGYGLGVDVKMEKQRRKLSHGGEVSGFTAMNAVYPDDGTAIVVLTNLMASKAPDTLTEKIAEIVFEHGDDATDAARTAQARAIYAGLQQGQIDRTLFSPNANEYFSAQALADFQSSLAPLGAPKEFKHLRTWLRGGMTGRSYQAVYPDKKLRVWTYELPDGKLEQLQVQVLE